MCLPCQSKATWSKKSRHSCHGSQETNLRVSSWRARPLRCRRMPRTGRMAPIRQRMSRSLQKLWELIKGKSDDLRRNQLFSLQAIKSGNYVNRFTSNVCVIFALKRFQSWDVSPGQLDPWIRAAVVAQLAEHSLLTQEILGSNPDICTI